MLARAPQEYINIRQLFRVKLIAQIENFNKYLSKTKVKKIHLFV